MADDPKKNPTAGTRPSDPRPRTARRSRRKKAVRAGVLVLVLLVLAAGGYEAWGYFGAYESTDDAQVDGHINAISARINGYVLDVPVEEEQYVKAGQVLVRIDPKDYAVALQNAQANLEAAEASLESSRTDVPITSATTDSQLKAARSSRTNAEAALQGAQRQLNAAQARLKTLQAQVREAQATHKKTSDDAARYKLLVAKEEIPQQQYDDAVAADDSAKATVDARRAAVAEAQQNIRVAQSAIEQANARIAQTDASVQSALTAPQQVAVSQARAKAAAAAVAQKRALVEQARLNLSYCIIVAPVSGIVGKRTVEIGENVAPGQQLMAVVPLDDIWVTADFKETQLRFMKPGQRVKFTVDAYDREYSGKVTGIGGASGSRLSLLPPENATGNYVKVVQRVPVRIDIDPNQNNDHRLRPGMSVDPKVYVQSN
jgi:membrane fusion protein, multidrug efflux system